MSSLHVHILSCSWPTLNGVTCAIIQCTCKFKVKLLQPAHVRTYVLGELFCCASLIHCTLFMYSVHTFNHCNSYFLGQAG